VAIADVYDALSSKRVYKEAWTEDDVLDEIKNSAGKSFDPELVEIFFEALTPAQADLRTVPRRLKTVQKMFD
jgi:HD-GYP domain-containing protein (c-di-GMP phosphodiesterase class II)